MQSTQSYTYQVIQTIRLCFGNSHSNQFTVLLGQTALPYATKAVVYHTALVVRQTSLQTTNNPFSKYLEYLVCITLQCFAILIAGHELWNGLAHVILHRMLSNELVSAATVLLHSFRSAHCS